MKFVDELSEVSRKRWDSLMVRINEVEEERAKLNVALCKNTKRSNDLFFKMKKFWENEKRNDELLYRKTLGLKELK